MKADVNDKMMETRGGHMTPRQTSHNSEDFRLADITDSRLDTNEDSWLRFLLSYESLMSTLSPPSGPARSFVNM